MIKDRARSWAQREADKVFKAPETKTAVSDYAKAQQSVEENRKRLKAQRLAREAKSAENCP
jgi:hypothetical protein